MKFFAFLLATLLFSHHAIAQDNDIEVFEKKDGNKNIVVARNVSKTSYLVTIEITAKGMDVTPSMTVESVVPGGYMKEMATLVPRPGEGWSYGYEVSFVEYTGQAPKANSSSSTSPATPSTTSTDAKPATSTTAAATVKVPVTPAATNLTSAPIVIYTQAGCGRCAFVKKDLTSRGVKFVEIDVNSSSPEVNNMWQKLREGGFNGDSITMPVVRVDGEYHYNIPDLPGFVATIK